MNTVAEQVASHLLQIKAIKLEPNHPFTWASGWKSPIYCDNRKTLSYPEVRTYIRDQFVELDSREIPAGRIDRRGGYRGDCTGCVGGTGTGVAVRVRAFRGQEVTGWKI